MITFFDVANVESIEIVEDEVKQPIKIRLEFKNNDRITIDIDEMELDAYYDSIDLILKSKYRLLLKK